MLKKTRKRPGSTRGRKASGNRAVAAPPTSPPGTSASPAYRALLRGVLDAVPVPVFVTFDRDARIADGNRAGLELVGMDGGKNFSQTALPGSVPPFRLLRDGVEVDPRNLPLQVAAREGVTVVDQELEVRRADGTSRHVVGSAAPLFGEEGEWAGAVAAFVDVTDRRQAEEAARALDVAKAVQASEVLFRVAFESSSVGMALMSPDGRPLRVNRKLCEMLGYSDQELLKVNWRDVTHPDDLEATAIQIMRAVKNPEEGGRQEKRYIRKDGKDLWAEVSTRAVLVGEAVQYFITSVIDITDRKQADAVIAERERELRTFLDAIPIPVFRKDAESRWLLGNRALFETVGKSAEACLGRSDLEIYGNPAVGRSVMENDRRIMASGVAEVVEEEVQTPTGLRTFHSTKVPYRDAEGKVIGVIGAALDITDRKRAEEALRVSEERLRSVLDGSNDGFWERDLVTGKVMHSARMNEILGLPAVDTYPGYHDWIGRMHPGDREKFQPIYDRVLSGEEERIDLVFRTRHANGSWMWIRARAKVSARNEEGKPTRFSGTITDVHQGMVAQEALRESEARFRALTDSAPVGIFQTDASGNNVFLNPAGVTMTGLTPEEARGAGWATAIHPDDKERVFREWTAAAAAGRDFTSEYRFLARDGKVTWVRCYGCGIRGLEAESSGYVGVFVDLTAQRTMQEQLLVASRLAAMGTLVAGVAHEINNPLAGTMAGQGSTIEDLRALRERVTRREAIDPDALVRELDEDLGSLIDAQVGAQRIARIVKDLVMFGRPDPHRTRVRLVDVVEEGMRWLPKSHVSSATIQVVNEDAPDVIASSGQLGQVIVNLVSNAAKSIPQDRRGVITIRVGRGSQGTACVEVTDDGSGIQPEVLPRIFDPFFSTREVGQGMGLGLSICYAIVTAHGGTLTVTSEVGKGSTFRVELPAAPAEA